jgi:hypothetical protein
MPSSCRWGFARKVVLVGRAKERLEGLGVRWLLAIALAIPIVALFVAWKVRRGWLWPALFIGAIISSRPLGFGIYLGLGMKIDSQTPPNKALQLTAR